MSDGIPTFEYGFEQGFAGKSENELNREALWTSEFKQESAAFKQIQLLNKFRYQLIVADPDWNTEKASVISTADHWFVTIKDKLLVVYTNYGADSGVVPITFNTGFAPGTTLAELFTNTTVSVADDGSVTTALLHGQPLVYLPTDLAGAQLAQQCGPVDTNGTNGDNEPGYKPRTGTKSDIPKSKDNGAPGLGLSIATITFAALFSIAFWL